MSENQRSQGSTKLQQLRNRHSDPRYQALHAQLSKLDTTLLREILRHPAESILYDGGNYDPETGKFCPLAIALGLDWTQPPVTTDAECAEQIQAAGFSPRNLKGLEGEFYREYRAMDLQIVLEDILGKRGENCRGWFHKTKDGANYCSNCGRGWKW